METFSEDDGGDNDYTQGDETEDEDECEDQDEVDDTDDLDASPRQFRVVKGGSKRDRSDTLYAQGIQGVQKKKSKQDLRSRAGPDRIRVDLTGHSGTTHLDVPPANPDSVSRRLSRPAFPSRPVVSTPSTVPLKATEAQIPNANRRIFDLAKPILASMLYLTVPWPGSVQAEAALCDEAWLQAINAQSVQLRAVGALERHEHVTVGRDPATWVMDSLTRGIVSFFKKVCLDFIADRPNSYVRKLAECGAASPLQHDCTLWASTSSPPPNPSTARCRWRPCYTTTLGWARGMTPLTRIKASNGTPGPKFPGLSTIFYTQHHKVLEGRRSLEISTRNE